MDWYREKVKPTWKIAFLAAFIIGMLIHTYKFTNVTPVADSLYNLHNSQNMVQSGRWLLSIACGLSSFYDLPWINGLFSVFFMAVTAAVIAEVFEMKNPVLIVISSGLLVSFPAIYATLGYGFTADGYMIAMLLAGLSVQLTKIPKDVCDKKQYAIRCAIGAVCLCCSCGIYQAYISFAYILAICYFIYELLRNEHTAEKYVTWIVGQVVMYIAALAAYYVIWKACLFFQGCTATSYQGLNQIGQADDRSLFDMIYWALYAFVLFFLEGHPLYYGVSNWTVLSMLVICAFVVGLVLAFVRSGCAKHKRNGVLIAICVCSIPFGCCVLIFTSGMVFYHALMMQSACVLFIFTGVLCEQWLKPKFSTAVGLLLCVVVLNNALMANIYYRYLDECFKRTQVTVAELNTRIHLLDDGSIRYVCYVGNLYMHDYVNDEDSKPQQATGPWKLMPHSLLSEEFIAAYSDFDLSYYRSNNLEYPVVTYPTDDFPFPGDYEFRFPLLSEEEKNILITTEEFRQMPLWPANGSVKVIGETIVVKFSEP